MYEDEPAIDGSLGLPDGEGFAAVLEAEEQRARRHGGIHGLVLVQVEPGDASLTEEVAIALSRSLRETDLLAQIDHRTFGVLALHCHALETVVTRLQAALETVGPHLTASISARSGGSQLQATWSALVTGDERGVTPFTARYMPFVALLPPSLN